jgi:hypothetical protein
MEAALERHYSILTEVISGHGGVVVTSRGRGTVSSPSSPALLQKTATNRARAIRGDDICLVELRVS